jgi:hypothetical protein
MGNNVDRSSLIGWLPRTILEGGNGAKLHDSTGD